MTEEEVHALIEEGARTGVFLEQERDLLKNVIRLADWPIETMMTLRADVAWLDIDEPLAANAREMAESPHSRYPVARGDLDHVAGVVQTKDLMEYMLAGGAPDLQAAMQPPLRVPLSISPLRLLEMFKRSPVHIALVTGLHGEVRGLITLHDVFEAIVGSLPTEEEPAESPLVRRDDGSLFTDGLLTTDELKEALGVPALPDEDVDAYETVGGFVLTRLGRVPVIGEHFEWGGWRFEIVDMDGQRIDRVLASRVGGMPRDGDETQSSLP